ncbi:hypothetical protein B4079_1809 [Bacillus cereus]|nr:hypothetical protein B4079_1809 [Bacillus cereus]
MYNVVAYEDTYKDTCVVAYEDAFVVAFVVAFALHDEQREEYLALHYMI